MVITRLFSQVTGVVAAIAITLGLITAPAPAARTLAEPAAAIQTLHIEVATVGLETALADVMTGVVDAVKTVALVLLSPVLVPLAFLSIGFTLGGTGICVSTGCEAEWQNPSWVAGRILRAVMSVLGPSTASPAATMAPPAAAVSAGSGATAMPAAAAEPIAPVVERGRGTAMTVERPTRGDSISASRRDTTATHPPNRHPAAATTAAVTDADETPPGVWSGKAGARTQRSVGGRV